MVDQLYAEQNKRDLLICEGRHRIGLILHSTRQRTFLQKPKGRHKTDEQHSC